MLNSNCLTGKFLLLAKSVCSLLECFLPSAVVKNLWASCTLSDFFSVHAGSGQQSVTGVSAVDDSNSYWRVRGKTSTVCERGTPVKCGQSIRLTHINTGRNLHSHHFTSPLSGNQVIPGLRVVWRQLREWLPLISLLCGEIYGIASALAHFSAH